MEAALHFIGALARSIRALSSAALLILVIRFTAHAALDLAAERTGKEPATIIEHPVDSSGSSALQDMLAAGQGSAHRPSLEELQKLAGAGNEAASKSSEPTRLPRRLLVDFGPERSTVFVNGRKRGQTPYGGQIHCSDGETITIQVLPPDGAPITRQAICRGKSVAAVTGNR